MDAAAGPVGAGVVVGVVEDSGGGSSVSGDSLSGSSVSSGPQSSISSSLNVSKRTHIFYDPNIPIGHKVVSCTKQLLLVLYQVLNHLLSRSPWFLEKVSYPGFPMTSCQYPNRQFRTRTTTMEQHTCNVLR